MISTPGAGEKNDLTLSAVVEGAKDRAKILGGSVALLWGINLVDTIGNHWLDGFGIHPRTMAGLWGILFAPFLHGSWGHLFANTSSLVILGWIVMLRKKRDFFTVGVLSALTAGIGTWLVGGANTVHIGASGVIFGLLGYLLSRGVFERKLWSILGSVLALVLFGGALRGLFPGLPGISWEGHLFGFLGGILAARLAAQPAAGEARRERSRERARIGAAPARRRIVESTVEDVTDEEVEALRRRSSR